MSSRGPASSSPPWREVRYAIPAHVPAMITEEEVRYLHWLLAEHWSGRWDVVELGPWLGGSTHCLAAGMATNPRRDPEARLQVIDNFRWQAFMAERAPTGLAVGDSFRQHFEANLGEHRSLLSVHEARLPDEPVVDVRVADQLEPLDGDLPIFEGERLSRPVELVFVDGAKSFRALSHLLRAVAPSCRPGALLVLQDCKAPGAYWVQMGMAALMTAGSPALELMHVLPENIVTLRLTGEPSRLASLPASIDDIPTARCLELLAGARSVFEGIGDEPGARMVDVSSVILLGSKGEWREAGERLESLERDWRPGTPAGSLDHVRSWLESVPEAGVRSRSRRRPLARVRRAAGRARRALRRGRS